MEELCDSPFSRLFCPLQRHHKSSEERTREGLDFPSTLPLKSHLAGQPQPAERAQECAWQEPHSGWTSWGVLKPSGLWFSFPDKLQTKSQPLTGGFSLESAAEERLKDALVELRCSQAGEGQQRKAFATSTVQRGQLTRSHPVPQTLRFRCLVQLEDFCSCFPSAGKAVRDLVQAELGQLMTFPARGYTTLPAGTRWCVKGTCPPPVPSPQINPTCTECPTSIPSTTAGTSSGERSETKPSRGEHHLLKIP